MHDVLAADRRFIAAADIEVDGNGDTMNGHNAVPHYIMGSSTLLHQKKCITDAFPHHQEQIRVWLSRECHSNPQQSNELHRRLGHP